MVDRVSTPIAPEETAGELEERLARLAADLLRRNLPSLLRGSFREEPQDEARATLAPKLPPGAGEIDWSLPPRLVARFILALSPRPGAYSFLSRSGAGAGPPERVRILRARAIDADGGPAGAPAPGSLPPPGAVSRVEKHGFRVAAGGGEVEILELQPAARGALTASEFLRGRPLSRGDRFGRDPGAGGGHSSGP